ncbi:restriction endonuclease subunit S [Vibrio vulnificus]|nr:restriction endonuclease subunit S [Vibrio vulnificus]EHI9275999.1 restriction endonuclease subunit S [Vibrio vulnificus]EID0062255.1 restriction endonuclease subunit S [Vibrio vulnificus]EID0718543.1 restriction endonuclease subunit S [Vibrio vulnificus]EID0742412.1 restriction endonuclease subunit S [Vibrio vulnificus]
MTTLGEYAKVQGGFAYKSKDFIGASEYRVLKIKNVRFGTIDYSEPAFVPKNIAESTINWKLKEGDILISMTGSGPNAPQSLVGRVARVWKNEPDAWFNQRVGRISLVDNKKIHPDFIFYWLSLPQNQDFLVANSSGSANQANISGKTIESLPTPIVDYEISSAIAKIARELDEKIILNTQTNQTLEQIAQAIFKSWFVDFDPVKAKIEALAAGGSADDAELAAMSVISAKTLDELNSLKVSNPEAFNKLAQTAALFPSAMQDSELGEIPKGWEVGKLANIIDFNPRRTLKKGTLAPYLDMKNVPTTGHLAIEVVDREMASGTKFVNGDTLLARITPCLENGKTAYVDFLKDNQVGWGSTEYIVMRPKEGYPTSIGYLLARDTNFRQQAIQSMTGTSGRQRADAKALAETAWLIYPKELVRAFDKTAKGYLSLAKINGDESKSLSEIRDALLPKLLSGELVGE